MAEPTAAELAKEAEKEAAVFSQAVDVDRLLTLLKAMDPSKDNLADNEEIQVRSRQLSLFYSIADFHSPVGIVQILYGFETKDCKTYRQV